MKRKLAIGGVAVAAIVLLSGFGFGRGHCDRGGTPEERSQRAYGFLTSRTDNALEELGATEAQGKQVHALKDELFRDGKALVKEHRESRKAFLAEWEAAQPDSTKVHRMVDERIDSLRAFTHKLADAALKLHGILTPEQRQELTAKAKERMERH